MTKQRKNCRGGGLYSPLMCKLHNTIIGGVV